MAGMRAAVAGMPTGTGVAGLTTTLAGMRAAVAGMPTGVAWME